MKVDIYKDKSRGRKVKYLSDLKISAIIPNYNYADFLEERIDSVLFQTYPVSQLIILDDASKDGSVNLIKKKIKEIKRKYPEIDTKLVVNDKNSGGCVFSQWQKGVKMATGDLIWIAEADDSCDRHFLETAVKKFEQFPSTVIFYSDSYRIDQNNFVVSETCSDWADMWQSGRWNEDYFNNGKDEIINYLSGTNPILNVSSVVWRNIDCLVDLFVGARDFKVAGDWYIYTRILEFGDIAYSSKPLNYYRKHDKGSASTVVKLMKEYKEVVCVQERVAKKFGIGEDLLEWQKVRRRGMGMVENQKNIPKKGKIAWLVPGFSMGSGGHRTVFQNMNYLIKNGYACDLYVESSRLPIETYNDIVDWYGDFDGDVFNDFEMVKEYDMVVATGWNTVKPIVEANCKKKMYFIQDYEPWFFPMGGEYIEAERTYKQDLKGVTIGRWLSAKVHNEYGMEAAHFDFCADLNNYKILPNVKKEKAICLIFQPGKPRRCDKLALKTLQIVQKVRPDLKIYLYGAKKYSLRGVKVNNLGVLPIEKCNELYNKCAVGLCMSASNPSRIPFEMMAAGLPVVELYKENNLYDLPECGVLLSEPTPDALATAILGIVDDPAKQKRMSRAGAKYMRDYPIEKGFEQFLSYVEDILSNKRVEEPDGLSVMYKKKPVEASEEIKSVSKSIKKDVVVQDMNFRDKFEEKNRLKRILKKTRRITKRLYLFVRDV